MLRRLDEVAATAVGVVVGVLGVDVFATVVLLVVLVVGFAVDPVGFIAAIWSAEGGLLGSIGCGSFENSGVRVVVVVAVVVRILLLVVDGTFDCVAVAVVVIDGLEDVAVLV